MVRNCNVKFFGGWLSSLKVLVFLSVFTQACGTDPLLTKERIYSGLALLSEAQLEHIDSLVREYTSDYQYISLGIIQNGVPVLERYYGEDRSAKSDVLASVSKPLTAMICMQFLEDGRIRSLDDPIGEYCSRYRDVMPGE
jgi:CubicO group peptidase (beta-lactamase class C family)